MTSVVLRQLADELEAKEQELLGREQAVAQAPAAAKAATPDWTSSWSASDEEVPF